MRKESALRAGVRGTALAAAVLFMLTATPASAHSRLLLTTPAAGALVLGSPASVSLVFNEAVQNRFLTVVVTAGDGRPHQTGPATAVGVTVKQAVTVLPAGPVRVAWRVVSADGHPVSGTFGFRVAAAPSPTPTTRAAGAATPSPSHTVAAAGGGNRSGGSWLWVWLLVGAAVVAAGVVLALRSRRQPAPLRDPGTGLPPDPDGGTAPR